MSRPTREQLGRTERIPVSSNRAPLVVRGFDHENFVGRWVNDTDDRIARFLEGGYEFVLKDGTSAGEPTVDSSSGLDSRVKKPVGQGLFAYLMRIPRSLWEQDQKAKQRELDQLDDAIRRPNKRPGGPVSDDVDYGEVSLQSRRGEEKASKLKFSKDQ